MQPLSVLLSVCLKERGWQWKAGPGAWRNCRSRHVSKQLRAAGHRARTPWLQLPTDERVWPPSAGRLRRVCAGRVGGEGWGKGLDSAARLDAEPSLTAPRLMKGRH